jgi:NDP-sugar pyrophosphorylase family protein
MDEHPEEDVMGVVPYKLDKTLSDYGTVSRGVCVFKGDELTKIHEYLKLEHKGQTVIDHETGDEFVGDERVSMNFWICKPKIFDEIEGKFITNLKEGIGDKQEIYIPIVIQDLIREEKIKVFATPAVSSWFGVTYAQDKSNAVKTLNNLTENQEYPSPIWKS